MPRVKFTKEAIVRDKKYFPAEEADFDEAAAKDVVKSEAGVIVGQEVRAAVDATHAVARKAVKLGG